MGPVPGGHRSLSYWTRNSRISAPGTWRSCLFRWTRKRLLTWVHFWCALTQLTHLENVGEHGYHTVGLQKALHALISSCARPNRNEHSVKGSCSYLSHFPDSLLPQGPPICCSHCLEHCFCQISTLWRPIPRSWASQVVLVVKKLPASAS